MITSIGREVPLLEGEFRYGERLSATMSVGNAWTLQLEYTLSTPGDH